MKNTLIAFSLFIVVACTATNKQKAIDSNYDSAADIDLFLSTSDETVENQVIGRLKSHDVDSAQIKQLLRATLPRLSQNPKGLQSNLKLKIEYTKKLLKEVSEQEQKETEEKKKLMQALTILMYC